LHKEDDMTLNDYRIEKKLTYGKLAKLLGAAHATIVRRWCLPVGHPQRMIPSPRYMSRIKTLTMGAVRADSFYMGMQ